MRPSQEMELDLEKPPPDGTFLVLNLRTNTVGLGNSCFFQSFPPIAMRTVAPLSTRSPVVHHAVAGGSDEEAIEIGAAVTSAGGNSTEEAPAPRRESRRKRRKTEEDKDPDWVVGTDVEREIRVSAHTEGTRRSNRLGKGVKRATSEGGNGDATVSSEEDPLGEIQLWEGGLPQSPTGGEDVVVSSGMEAPPMYLVNLLKFFGWVVTFRDGHEAVYTSPQGLVYHSLPKAYEDFLHDSFRRKETESSSPQALGVGDLGTPDLNQQTGNSAGYVIKEGLKRRGRKKRKESKQLASMQERSENDGKLSLWLPEETASPSKEVNRVVTTCKTHQSSSKNKILHCQLAGPRRSARLRGKHTFYGSDSDSENDADNGSLYSPGATEERPPSLTSDDANTMCDKKSKACMEVNILGPGKPDCGSEVIIERNHNCSSIMPQPNVLREPRRRGRRKKEHVSLDVETNVKSGCVSIFVDLSEISDNDMVKDKEKIASLSPQTMSAPHEDPKSCNKIDHLMKDMGKFDNNNTVLEVNAQASSTGIKRDTDLNGKDVAVDDGMGMDMGVGACFSNLSMLAVNSLTPTSNEKPKASTFEDGNMGGGTHTPDDLLATDVLAEEVDFDLSRVQVESEINMPKKVQRIMKNDSEICIQHENNIKASIPSKCFPYARKRKSPSGGNLNGRKKKRRGGCRLTVRKNVKYDNQKETFSQNKVTALSWLIYAGVLSENEMLMHTVTNDRGDHLRGMVTRDGIWCVCCKKIMSLFEFESHTGGDTCQPWYNICLSSGKSLMQCQIEAWEKEKKQRKVGFQTVEVGGLDPSDDTCGVCADGGHLICCDSCPSTFHQDCVMLKAFPEGRWHCPYCICIFCSVAEHGTDETNKTLSMFTCQQCYRKYHWECTQQSGMHEKLAESLLFCGKHCMEVDAGLLQLLGVVNKIGEGFSWTLLKRLDEHEELNTDQKLLFMMECNRKLSMALSVLNECFMPLVDFRTSVDMISHAVFNGGSNFNRLNYAGFYTAILEKDEEIISVASLRFHGRHLAEMPFIGTRPMHRRQGMCRRLLKAIEELLSSLHVEKLIVPATPELLETWITSFSFKSLEQSLKHEIRNLSLVAFPQTFLLQKSIPPNPGGKDHTKNDSGGAVADHRTAAPSNRTQNLQSSVGKQTNSESCIVGGGSGSSRWNFESCSDKGKHAALQSHGGVKGSSSAGGVQMVNSCAAVSEASRPAQNTPTLNQCSDAPSMLGATGSAFSSFDRVHVSSSGGKEAAGPAGISVAARPHSAGMAKNMHGDGVRCISFTAGFASDFRWTSS